MSDDMPDEVFAWQWIDYDFDDGYRAVRVRITEIAE